MKGIVKKENKKITQITDAYIKWEEVQAALKKLKRNKAESADKIPQEFYKLVEKEKVPTSELAKALCTTLRDVFETGIIPESWKNSVIVPVYKKGDVNDTNNYRGISIIKTAYKILCKLLTSRISGVNDDFELIIKEQVGFVRRDEALGQVTTLIEILERRKQINKDTLVIFLVLKKHTIQYHIEDCQQKQKQQATGLN